jgi:hypothetical protein
MRKDNGDKGGDCAAALSVGASHFILIKAIINRARSSE